MWMCSNNTSFTKIGVGLSRAHRAYFADSYSRIKHTHEYIPNPSNIPQGLFCCRCCCRKMNFCRDVFFLFEMKNAFSEKP